MIRPWHIFILGALIFASPSSAAEVEHIEVVSILTGPRSLRSNLMIVRKGDEYFADFQQYSPGQIQRLMEAAAAPPIPRLAMKDLGVTQKWLDANAERALNELKQSLPGGEWPQSSENDPSFSDARFLESFKNLKKVRTLLHDYYQEKWKDDYPVFKVDIYLQGGEAIIVRSTAQHLTMIPWVVERDGKKFETFNPRISAALADLLPWMFATNRDRLSGDLAQLIARRLFPPPIND